MFTRTLHPHRAYALRHLDKAVGRVMYREVCRKLEGRKMRNKGVAVV
jgi:hypothetical protein